jgi:fatty-acyl-CoA synthase
MMQTPLLLTQMIERAERYFPKKEIVSRTESGIHRFTYKQWGERTRRLASALSELGVEEGDKVGTLAWNHHRHLEAYFAIPCSGAILHTINIRLSPQHISYIINHAGDKVLLVDPDILPLIEKIKDSIPVVEAFIVMTDGEMPETSLENVYHYEQLLEEGNPSFPFRKDLDEHAPAGMCYTSATTGNPKGVIYSHRGIVLHAMALGLADTTGVCEKDVALPVVPMFHVNAWGLPFASVWFGTKQVLPGPYFTPGILAGLMQDEKVTITAGVPTIWLGL